MRANVLVPTLRHPLLLAKQLASVDRLSGGRVVVGVGAGWLREEFDALQVPFQRRGTRLEEHIQVMRNLWENTVAAHDGPSYPHAALGLSPTPHAEGGRIPIIIGGHSDRALRRVARMGDGWAVVASPAADMLAAYAERLATLRRMCQEVGRDFDELMLVAQVPATIGVPILEQIAALGRACATWSPSAARSSPRSCSPRCPPLLTDRSGPLPGEPIHRGRERQGRVVWRVPPGGGGLGGRKVALAFQHPHRVRGVLG